MDTFYVTQTERSPLAVLFRGNLRKQDSEAVFAKVQERLQAQPGGLGERVQLLLMPDFTPPSMDDMDAGEDAQARPIFLAISTQAQPKQPTAFTYVFSLATLVASAFTAFAYALGTFALNTEFFAKVNDGDLSVASQALPVAAGILGLQLVHELAHRLAALASGKKNLLGPPVFIPSLQVGTFGTITPFTTFPRDRKQAFDVSVAGPALGAVVSLGALIGGLLLTGGATTDALAAFPVVPAALFHSSAIIGTITSIALPQAMLQALSTPVPLHPLAVIGFTGVIVNALNLMPVGRLDGGRLAAAGFGRRTAAVLGTLTLLLQAASAIFNNYSLQLFWGLVVIIFQRGQDLPALDEVSEVDEGRNTVLLVLLAFALFTLVPFPSL
ncbi:hypothetical protein JKP88DRAFT_7497 [Tribonema minus]|uniref:Peptidase M50 domain-containing protein n=1 Tax=Tribonema minus TaxID=303371 RepID=A0A835ZIQ3_9STRA|nr:hypothetical protein JKP88DRAFT_7497 [Tribonema minus]